MDTLERIHRTGIVPVVVIQDAKDAVSTARALCGGGIDVMEITLRTQAGLASIRSVSSACPDVLTGAGTVLSLDQCKEAVNAGAKFIVSPGFDPHIVSWCAKNGAAVIPGCVTPTEITMALQAGLNVLKFFPADVYGGLKAMKALTAPFAGIRFIPTGGVGANNLVEYLSASCVFAVGGSWLCPMSDIKEGNFEKIQRLSAEAKIAARQSRPQ